MFWLFFPALVLLNWPEAQTGTVWCESPKKLSNFWRLHFPSHLTVSTFCSCRASRAARAVCIAVLPQPSSTCLFHSLQVQPHNKKGPNLPFCRKFLCNSQGICQLWPRFCPVQVHIYVMSMDMLWPSEQGIQDASIPTEGQAFYSQLGDRGEYKACFTAELRQKGENSSFLTQAF